MWRGDLTWAETQALAATLKTTHQRRIDVDVLTLNERHVGSLSPLVLDGQITVDAKSDPATPSRMVDMTIVDADRVLDLEPGSITGAPLHRKFMLRVHYTVRVPEMGEWVQIPGITGPLWDFERSGAEVHLVAHGKERQALGQQWTPRPFRKKTKKTDAIRTLLRGTGERRLAIPDLRDTLPDRFTVGPMDQPWVKAQIPAKSLDRHLFYDASGVARLRGYPTQPCLLIDEQLLAVSEPSMKRSSEGVHNTFEVLGANPKGPKKRVRGVATLPTNHASSARSLIRHDEPHYLVMREENEHLKTKRDCQRRADRLRDIHWTIANDCRFDMLPDPRLEEYDMVAVETDLGRVRVQMLQWSIPLGMDAAPMTVGTVRRTTRARKAS